MQNKQKWAEGEEVDRTGSKYFARSLKGRTAGLLGYGALGRETARLLQAFGMRIVACNTSGKRTEQDGVSPALQSLSFSVEIACHQAGGMVGCRERKGRTRDTGSYEAGVG